QYNHRYTDRMKTAISIPDQIFVKAESLADDLGLTRSGLYVMAISELIARHQGAGVTDRLNEVYSVEDGRMDRALMAAQVSSLLATDW
nr:hypothetical protein [Gemmatimonadota bacterium]